MRQPGEDAADFLQLAVDDPSVPAAAEFLEWLVAISRHVPRDPRHVTVRVVDAAESQALNRQFRGKDAPTNVLSFPADLPEDIDADYLGDIVVCAEVVRREARDQNKSLPGHWAHMLVHGVLHLQGYDHQEDAEAAEMEALETEILGEMGYPDPYAGD